MRHARHSVLFSALALPALCFLLLGPTACQTIPEVRHLARSYEYDGRAPIVTTAAGRLSRAESDSLYFRLLPQARTSPLLGRQTAFVQETADAPVIAGNRVHLLNNGKETFAFMNEAIRGARDHINIETFIFRDDEVGRFFSKRLIEKRAEGVNVNLIYDGYGNRRTPSPFYEEMQSAGVRLLEFNALTVQEVVGEQSINFRDHRKILVVDGKTAFTGGINFYWEIAEPEDRSGTREVQPWRDSHIRIDGPAAAEFQRIFFRTWQEKDGPAMGPGVYFPPLQEEGDLLIQVISDSPDRKFPAIYAAYLSAFMNARKSIHLTHSYIAPPEEMLEVLEDAAASGIDVKLIVPSFSDFWLPLYAGRGNYSRLLKSGVRIFEFQGAILHSKNAVVDGVWSAIGSANLVPRSFVRDLEISAVILGPEFGKEMEKIFENDLSESVEVRLDQWEKRPIETRFMEWLARIFQYWL